MVNKASKDMVDYSVFFLQFFKVELVLPKICSDTRKYELESEPLLTLLLGKTKGGWGLIGTVISNLPVI